MIVVVLIALAGLLGYIVPECWRRWNVWLNEYEADRD